MQNYRELYIKSEDCQDYFLQLKQFLNYKMSYEFTNKIQELTNKIQYLKKFHPKNDKFQEVKQQLKTLEYTINKQLNFVEKRIRKVQVKLQTKLQQTKQQMRPLQTVLYAKEEKVSQLIGEWVDQYQLRAQEAQEDLNKEEQVLKAKKEEEEHFFQKQAEFLQNKINTQIKVLQKQIGKLGSINTQNQSSLLKQLACVKNNLIKQLNQSVQAKNRESKVIGRQRTELKQRIKEKIAILINKIEKRASKTCQILALLLQI